MALSTITFGKLAQSEDVNPIIRLLQGTAGTEQAVSLVTNTHATNPSLTLRATHATGTSLKIRDYADAIDVVKVSRHATFGNVVQLASDTRFGIGTGVSNTGLMYINASNSDAEYVMSDFVYDNSATVLADVGTGRFMMRTLANGGLSATRALEAHTLKVGAVTKQQRAIECSLESVTVGNGADLLIGISIRNDPTMWGMDPTYGTGRRCDTALLIGEDEKGWTNFIRAYGCSADAQAATVLFNVAQTGSVSSSHLLPLATGAHDVGATANLWRFVYADRVRAGNGTEALPSLGFNGDADNGFYLSNANEFKAATNAAERMCWDGLGNVSIGTAALATNATDGFLYIPTCAGTPTGVPTAKTGRVAIVFDTTNNEFYVYDGAWISTSVFA